MTIKERIFATELDTLYRSLPLPLFMSWFNSLFLAGILYNHIPKTFLYLWIFSNTLITAMRYGSYFYYRHVFQSQSTKKLYYMYIIGLLLSASIWGSSSLFLLFNSLAYGLIVVFIAGGMVAGALGSVAYRFETYYLYNVTILIPFIIILLLHPSQEFHIMGFILFLFGGMLLVASKKFYTHSHNSISLQFQQEETLKALASEKKRIEELNTHLSQEIKAKEETQMDLVKALEASKQSAKAKEAFFATMSHELRTPLNSIIGFSQILSRKKELPDNILTYIEKIFFSGRHLLDLVNTILDFSKLKSGKMEPHFAEFSLKDLFYEISIMCEPLAQKETIDLHYPTFEFETIMADRKMLYQVFLNILSNAIKFSPQNDRIKCTYEHTDVHLFTICDHGPGISSEMYEKIFEPFMQIDNIDGLNSQGTGLGLSIVKEMIEIHNGKIWVESILGKGSCFYISLPMTPPSL
jgi:signal transduction histidine kinase